jgi:hypothetical protein
MTDGRALTASKIRCRVDPGDVAPVKAARRLGLTLDEFEARLPALLARGFPPADVTTGMYDLDEIDRWRARRHGAGEQLTAASKPADSQLPSMGDRFIAATKRSRDGRAA